MQLQDIIALDKQYYLNTFGDRLAINFVSGKGSTLYDADGHAYIDFFAGIAVSSLGYTYPAYTQALKDQIDRLLHTSSIFYIEQQSRLAQVLVENCSFAKKVFFCNSGTEANEGAVKLARKYFYNKGEDRYEIISLNNSFHGRTLSMVAATGQEKYQKPYKPLLSKAFINVDAGDIELLRGACTEHTCAIMLEVIQGEGGVIELGLEYLQAVEALCREQGILLIIDEVQTGMGRTGKLFAHEHYGLKPDIVTLAKGLGGGVPIGAILAGDPAYTGFEVGDHGTTFGGNFLASTAGIAVLDALLGDGILEDSVAVGDYFKAALEDLAKEYPAIVAVRGCGLMLGLQLHDDLLARDVASAMLKAGFVVGTAAQNTLRFVPPLVITQAEVSQLVDALKIYFNANS